MALSCRPQTTSGMPSPSRTPVPQVRHPLSAIAQQHNNLNILGSAPNIMPFRDINNEHYHYIVPKRLNEPLDFAVPQRKKTDLRGLPRLNLDEIEMTVMEKLRKERYAVRCLFRNNDTLDRGYVTKGALLKIMYTLCGSIRVEHFHKLLEKYNLDEYPVITFEQFEHAFGPRSPGQGANSRWIATRLANRHVSVAHAQAMLRDRAEHANFNLKAVLPEACFLPAGLVLKPQWREALELIGIRMSDQDFEKFWMRFDREGSGAVPTSVVLTMLHLDADGRPKAPIRSSKVDTARSAPPPKATSQSARQAAASPKSADAAPKKPQEKRFIKQLDTIKSRRPRYDDIKSCLHYLFEENYNAIIVAFQQFDHKGDGHVSRFDFRHVLKEHGFTISQPDLDSFLSRIGMRISHNVHYREFCNKFQSRTEFSLVNRIISNSHHPCSCYYGRVHFFGAFNTNAADFKGDSLTPEEMEGKMVEFFQSHFLELLGLMRKADPEKRGLVSAAAVQSAIEAVLGYAVSEAQMAQFKEYLRFDKKSNDVHYNDMLQLFNKPPNLWHKRKEPPPLPSAAQILANGRAETPSTLQALPPEAFEAALPTPKEPQTTLRPEVAEKITAEKDNAHFASLCAVVEQLLRIRFHSVDKMFKLLDVRNSGRLTKGIFAQLLLNHHIKATDAEIDRLWSTLRSDPAKMNYRQILRHFMTNMTDIVAECNAQIKKSQLHRRLPPLNGLKDPNLARLREHRRQQKEKVNMEMQQAEVKQIAAPPVSEEEIHQLCQKIAPQIIENWEPLKYHLRSLDQVGYAAVDFHHMSRIFRDLELPLSDDEAAKVIHFFDTKKNARFSYIDFLKRFSQPVEKNPAVFNKVTHELKDKKSGHSATVVQILEKIREHILHKWKTLLRGFRKMDVDRTGYITEFDLQKVLREQHIHLSKDDLFHLLTEFDVNFDGKIVYNEFIRLMLNVF